MAPNNGFWHKMLRVDLTNRTTRVETIEEIDFKRFLGGAGLGAEILRRELPAKLDAYDPRNLLIFATGPFQGTPVPGGAKFSVVAISPVSQTFGDSAGGASWGPALKDAGYDLLLFEGVADKPVYISMVDDQIEFRDASALWGKDTVETIDLVREELGDPRRSVAAIGPAGERHVAIACISFDKHSFAGRAGLGAVMGSKNLKAIAVRGTKKVPLHDPEKAKALFKKFSAETHQAVLNNKFRANGTPGLCETAEGLGDMPIKYWDGDVWPEGAERLGAPNYTAVLNAKPLPCKYCSVGCHRDIVITEPEEYALPHSVGPEYETLGLMGTGCMVDDPKAVAKANDVANRLGVDTISAGAMVGFAMECWEKGWITKKETGGLEFNWGDPKALIKLTELIGNREGFGEIFAEGTLPAAHKIGPQTVPSVVHCKGLDIPAHDPRACFSLATSYATGTRGACHFRGPCEDIEMGGFFMPEIGIEKGIVTMYEPKNQALVAIKCQDLGVVCNSLVLCLFMVDGAEWSLTGVTEMLNAITGWNYSVQDMMDAGERGFTVQRMLNVRDGYDASTDKLPKKMFEAAKVGMRAGKSPPLAEMLVEYYEIRGWNEKGEPNDATLARLEL